MDCCKVPEAALKTERAVDRCGRCGARGRGVSAETMEGLLEPRALARMRNRTYVFDRSPDCDVVYFSNEADSLYVKGDLTVRVGIKEKDPPIPLCYCFGHTLESVREEIESTGGTTILERIEAEIKAGNCRCAVRNPSGSCCLGEVHHAIGEIERELHGSLSRNPMEDRHDVEDIAVSGSGEPCRVFTPTRGRG